jgi:uncharacterized protein YutE (UPF0331/DUF86 family)
MSNIDVIENKISAIRRYLGLLESYKHYGAKELASDPTVRGAVERYLYLVAQAAIDLAEAVIAFKNLRKPTTLGESFDILEEADIIPGALKENLVKMVGFRNILAHDYGEIDYKIVVDVLRNRLGDIEQFVEKVKSILFG